MRINERLDVEAQSAVTRYAADVAISVLPQLPRTLALSITDVIDNLRNRRWPVVEFGNPERPTVRVDANALANLLWVLHDNGVIIDG